MRRVANISLGILIPLALLVLLAVWDKPPGWLLNAQHFFLFGWVWDKFLLNIFAFVRGYLHPALWIIVAVASVTLFMITREWFWEIKWVNALLLALIDAYITFDPRGKVYLLIACWMDEHSEERPDTLRYRLMLLRRIERSSQDIFDRLEARDIAYRQERAPMLSLSNITLGRQLHLTLQHRLALAEALSIEAASEKPGGALLLCEGCLLAVRLERQQGLPIPSLACVVLRMAQELFEPNQNSEVLACCHDFLVIDGDRLILRVPVGRTCFPGESADGLGMLSDFRTLRRESERRLQVMVFLEWMEDPLSKQDYQSVIQACAHARMQMQAETPLAGAAIRLLGFAWWQHAAQLGDNAYGQMAWQNSLKSFVEAGRSELLALFEPPFQERGGG